MVVTSVNPSVFGQRVTFTATVTASSPVPGTPTGTVTFKDGSASLGTGALNASCVASFTTSTLTVGAHRITAVYGGDTNFTASTSSSVLQTVHQASTTTTLTSSVSAAVAGQPVTFTATVTATPPGAGTATGLVTFEDGTTSIGTASLSAGSATCTTSALSVATHTISAVYGGDNNFTGSTSGTIMLIVIPPPAATPPSLMAASLLNENSASWGGDPASMDYSSSGSVRYADGSVHVSATDLSSSGFGSPFGQTRTWDSQPIYAGNPVVAPEAALNGSGWNITQLPWLLQDGNTVIAMGSGAERFFDFDGSSYQARFFVQDKLVADTRHQKLVLTDTAGDQLLFNDFTVVANSTTGQPGQFVSLTDPSGIVIDKVNAYTSTGNIAEIQRTGGGATESYLYTYLPSGDPNAGLLQNVTLRRETSSSGPWTTVRQVDYTYYTGSQPYGNLGDLMTAAIEDGASPTPNVLDTDYYRYYTGESGGQVHDLKYVFNSLSYARLAGAYPSTDPTTLSDTQVAKYADNSFQFDSQNRVAEETVQGAGCSVCTGGFGTFTYSYTTSSNPASFNSWQTKTVETLPDGNTNTVYTNAYGEVMLTVFQSGSQKWESFTKYDSAGRIIQLANPSALTGYDDTQADLLDNPSASTPSYAYLADSQGLITVTDYYTSTSSGAVAGYVQDVQLRQGKTGVLIPQSSVTYVQHSNTASPVPMTVTVVATQTVYPNDNQGDITFPSSVIDPTDLGSRTTSYSYIWYGDSGQSRHHQSHRAALPGCGHPADCPDKRGWSRCARPCHVHGQ